MLRIKALGPCTIAGFHTLLRGEVCDVPDGREDQVERLRIVGRVELLDTVAAEPSGNDAPPPGDSPAPAALMTDDEAELARLEAELAALENGEQPVVENPARATETPPAPVVPKRPLFVCECGHTAPEHVKGKTKVNDWAPCGGLRKDMKRAAAAAE